jgi:hypothetical protein
VLHNDKFDGTVTASSRINQWNNNSIVLGDVNNLGGNYWRGTLLNAPNGFSGTIPGTQFTVGKPQ